MLRLRLRSPLAWSSLAAIAGQFALPAITVAATGGGDFPALRLVSAVL